MAEELLGDVNCDGAVNLVDVAPFVEAISIGEFSTKADINLDLQFAAKFALFLRSRISHRSSG